MAIACWGEENETSEREQRAGPDAATSVDEASRTGHAFAVEQGLHRTDAQPLLAVLRAEREGDPPTRRVTLHHGETAAAVGQAWCGPLGRRIESVLADYSPGELALVTHFVRQMTAVAHRPALPAPDRGGSR